MMRIRQAGFTLVELLVVTVLTALVLGGVYQTLIVQEKTYEAAGLLIHDQESLRTALGILESELREVGSIGGTDIGGSDIGVATADSVTFRAHRKTGFICKLSRNEKWAIVWTLGDPFESGDPLLLFVDNDSIRYADDRWDTTAVTNVTTTEDSDCTNYWPDAPLQLLKMENHDLTGVRVGGPLRSYEWVTYGLYEFGPMGWGLGRTRENQRPAYLVGGLAGPGEGLRFRYFTPTGAETNDPTQVSRVQITVQSDPPGNTDVTAAQMTTNLFLRNN